jgi:hypothetical protein
MSSADDLRRYISDVGIAIQRKWKQANFNEGSFAEIACNALSSMRVTQHIGVAELVDWIAKAKTIPYQPRVDDGFGQPCVTMYWDERVRVDLLFWHSASIGIHSHTFSGAFAVLHGDAVECCYKYQISDEISSHIMLGSTSVADVKCLSPGDVRLIYPGTRLIHTLFHLGRPSVSLVARTTGDLSTGHEYSFFPPGVAITTRPATALQCKQLQLLSMLHETGAAVLQRTVLTLLRESDLHTAFLLLMELGSREQPARCYEQALALACEVHGDRARLFGPAVEEQLRRSRIGQLSRSIFDDDLRFFLVLLCSLPDYPSIAAAVSSRFPDRDGLQLVANWAVSLAERGALGVECDLIVESVIRCCVGGAAVSRVRDRLGCMLGPEQVASQLVPLQQVYEHVISHPLLSPIFRRDSP